jgi:hypothetical protein
MKMPTPLGQLDLHLFTIDWNGRSHAAGYTDYPKGTASNVDQKLFFDRIRDGQATTIPGKVLSEKNITLDKQKHAGREIIIEVTGKDLYSRSRYYLVGDRLYVVTVVASPECTRDMLSDSYLDSFKLDR